MQTSAPDAQTNKWMTIGDAAKHLNVSRDTLRRWEKAGKISAVRSPTNRRYYTLSQLERIMSGVTKDMKTETPKARRPKTNIKLSGKYKLAAAGVASFILGALLFLILQSFVF